MARYAVRQKRSIAWKETDSLLQAEQERAMAYEAGIRDVEIVDQAFGSAIIDLRLIPTLDRPGHDGGTHTREALMGRAVRDARPAEGLHVVYMLPSGHVVADSRRPVAEVLAFVQANPGCTVAAAEDELGQAQVEAALAAHLLQQGPGPREKALLEVVPGVTSEEAERVAPRRVPELATNAEAEGD